MKITTMNRKMVNARVIKLAPPVIYIRKSKIAFLNEAIKKLISIFQQMSIKLDEVNKKHSANDVYSKSKKVYC